MYAEQLPRAENGMEEPPGDGAHLVPGQQGAHRAAQTFSTTVVNVSLGRNKTHVWGLHVWLSGQVTALTSAALGAAVHPLGWAAQS